MPKGRWGLGFQDPDDGERWSGCQHGGRQRASQAGMGRWQKGMIDGPRCNDV